jgi:hypothetical protein
MYTLTTDYLGSTSPLSYKTDIDGVKQFLMHVMNIGVVEIRGEDGEMAAKFYGPNPETKYPSVKVDVLAPEEMQQAFRGWPGFIQIEWV